MPQGFPTLIMHTLYNVITPQLVSIIHPIHVIIIHINELGNKKLFSGLVSKHSSESTCICDCFCWASAETFHCFPAI